MSREVNTRYGRIAGIEQEAWLEFRGIPFAKAPVGDLRWRAPQAPEAWEGTYLADQFKAKAVQREGSAPPWDKDFYDDPAFERPSSEDCLYLNIWVPKEAKDCPVAIWIHGGAFMGGFSSEKEFDGAAYAKRGVILVSIQYRLGIFGFLAHPWLTAEAGTSGNYGMLDQIAAINWVYDNIRAFGGDPENITIFGQSAGAMSVQTLVSSPLTGDRIKRAILQSGGSYGEGLHRDMTLAEAEQFGLMFSELLEVQSLEEMRAKSTAEIFAATDPFMAKAMPKARGLFLTPNIDGILLTDGYYATIDQGKIKDIPYMLGSTKNDITVEGDPKDPMESPLHRGCLAFSKKLEELGRKPAYVYYFQRNLPGDAQGAWHSAELWYMMGTLSRCWRPFTPEDYALSNRMLDHWCNFMRYGDPNGAGLPEWKPCSKEDAFVEIFDVE